MLRFYNCQYYLFSHATCQGFPDVASGQTRIEIYAYGCRMDMNKGLTFLLKLSTNNLGHCYLAFFMNFLDYSPIKHLTLTRTFKTTQVEDSQQTDQDRWPKQQHQIIPLTPTPLPLPWSGAEKRVNSMWHEPQNKTRLKKPWIQYSYGDIPSGKPT